MWREGRFPLVPSTSGPRAAHAREDAVGGDADSQLVQVEDLLLDPARDERVLDLEIEIACTACACRTVSALTSERADVADIARLDQLADRTQRLLDRGLGEDAPGPVDIHVVGAKPSEPRRRGSLGAAAGRTSFPMIDPSGARRPELDADHRLVAAPRP